LILCSVYIYKLISYIKFGEQMPALKEVANTCSKCGVKLTSFIAYVPGRGEVCLKCYTDYARNKEELELTDSKT
jgi:hypothetical protein